MKYLSTLLLILMTSVSFAQDAGLIVGKVLDKEMSDTPLAFANISIKDTSINVTSDLSGMFLLENLKDGEYTLVCKFAGYESKEVEVTVSNGLPAEVKLSLGAFVLPHTEIASKANSKEQH